MQNKLKNICDFYAITHKLKNVLRTGWVIWEVKAERFESVAEHIYGTQMLAFVINSEFELGLDIEKISLMLAMHELGETIVGDIPLTYVIAGKITKEEKRKSEREAVVKILEPLNDKQRILKIFDEFEEGKTNEAKFAKRIDKLESCFQCKFHEEKGYNDFNAKREGIVEKLRLDSIAKGWETMVKLWIENDKQNSDFDELFKQIADYLGNNAVFVL